MTEPTELVDPAVQAEAKVQAIAKEFEQFAYIVSHDMGAPVRHVREFVSLLLDSLSEHVGATEQKYVDFIRNSTDRLQGMLDGMLAYSRLNTQRRQMRDTDLGPLVQQIVNYDFASHASQVEVEALPNLPCDRTQVQALFGNLIENALKFHEDPAVARVQIRCEERPEHWAFSVSDNGIGIDERNHERIFEIMARLHAPARFPGLGFGLALANKIVQRHGGEISVESEPGAGATFHFTLSKHPND